MNMNVMTGNLNTCETANGLPYVANLTPTGPYPQTWVDLHGNPVAPQPGVAFAPQNWSRSISSTTYSFAWALSAGLGFQINPSTTLDIGYRYLNAGQTTKLLNLQTGLTLRQNNVSQQLLVGVRYVLQ